MIATPLGIGKPNQLLNAFYERACSDPGLELKIMTGLSLEKPQGANDLERRFLTPWVERCYADYPEFDYVKALRSGALPSNIEIHEFYFSPGRFLGVDLAQQGYVSSNYTHIARDLMAHGVNVLAQMVSKKDLEHDAHFSLSSNPDITLELAPMMRNKERNGTPVAIVGQVNKKLPFMYRDAVVAREYFDFIIDHPVLEFEPFALPNAPIETADHLIGLYSSALISDSGTLQVGIGSLADAVTHAIELRHCSNAQYKRTLSCLGAFQRFSSIIETLGDTGAFEKGLYCATEMFSYGLLRLYQVGVVNRKVYDHVAIQRLLNEGRIEEVLGPKTLDVLLEKHIIASQLNPEDFNLLQRFGILRSDVQYRSGCIYRKDGEPIRADLRDPGSRQWILEHALGNRLSDGTLMHGAFFLGPKRFYETLRNMGEEELSAFCMTSVNNINDLYGNQALAAVQRTKARFINAAMKMTLNGAAVSDALEDGQVVSGVGGQYNFVAMAHELPDARSILVLRSTRYGKRGVESNILWSYGHVTVPRHLRDIVVTEYGIADLRGRSDKDVIAAMLNITDSRFQGALLRKAKGSGKLPKHYQIPAQHRNNTPERLQDLRRILQQEGSFPLFPYGTDLAEDEVTLLEVLRRLKRTTSTESGLLQAFFKALTCVGTPPDSSLYLKRLGLDDPRSWRDRVNARLVVSELKRLRAGED